MKKRIVNLGVVILIFSIIFCTACSCKDPNAGKQAEDTKEIGKVVDFSIKTVDGDILTPEDFRGKVLMIDYWATWCAPCRAEFPHFDELLDTFGDDLVIIAISADEDRKTLDKFLEEFPLRYIIGLQFESELPSWPKVLTLPEAFFIDHTGVLRANLKGGQKTIDPFLKIITPLIDDLPEREEPEVEEIPAEDLAILDDIPPPEFSQP